MHAVGLFLLSLALPLASASTSCLVKGIEHQDGETFTDNGVFVHRCSVFQNGWRTQVVGCIAPDGETIGINDTFKKGNFVFKCNESGTEIVACIVPSGTEIAVGSTFDAGQTRWICENNDNGGVRLYTQ